MIVRKFTKKIRDKNFRPLLSLLVGVLLFTQSQFAFGNTAKLKFFEAEDYFSKEREFVINDDTFLSKGAYIAVKDNIENISQDKLLVHIPFKGKGSFTIWINARNLNMSVRSSNGVNKTIKTPVRNEWCWVSGGVLSDKEIGGILEIYATKIEANSGIDVILFSNDPHFQPKGVYNEFFSAEEKTDTQNKVSEAKEPIKFIVSSEKISEKISSYLVTACADDPLRHTEGQKRGEVDKGRLIAGNPRWDATMQTFFQDNMLILLFRPIRKKDKSYDRWDFDALDKFVKQAKTVWGCLRFLRMVSCTKI